MKHCAFELSSTWMPGSEAGACAVAVDTLAWLLPAALTGALALGWLSVRLRRRGRTAGGTLDLRYERRMRVLAEQAVAGAQQQVCSLKAQLSAVRDDERQRIARDVHDDLGQNLLAMKLQLAGAAQIATPQLQRQLQAIDASVDRCIASLRAIIHDLTPTALEAGLRAAVVRQLEDFTRIHGVLHQLHLDVGRPAPDPKRDAALLRVLQEALSNIARHAKASQVRVSMSWSSEQLALSVADNGVGLPPPAQRRGCGLPGIFERVQALGGCLVLKSEPGAGTRLSITIPLAATGSQETAHAA